MTFRAELEENTEEAWRMRQLGFTTMQIAEELKVSRETVCRCIRRKMKQRLKEINFSDERLAEIYDNLDRAEKESWRKFKTTGEEKWLNLAVRVQDRKMLFFGIGKQTVNLLQQNNFSKTEVITISEIKKVYGEIKDAQADSREPEDAGKIAVQS